MKSLINNSYLVKFVIIGDGPYKTEMLNLIKKFNIENEVIYLDKLHHDKAIEYYNIIDIAVYPKKKCDLCSSSSGIKILEAMAMEKPIIASSLDSINELINDENTGILCETDNKEELLQKIKLLIQNEELRNNLGKNAREWVIDNRQWSSVTNTIKEIYDKI